MFSIVCRLWHPINHICFAKNLNYGACGCEFELFASSGPANISWLTKGTNVGHLAVTRFEPLH